MAQLQSHRQVRRLSLGGGLAVGVLLVGGALPAAQAGIVPLELKCRVLAGSDHGGLVYAWNHAYQEEQWGFGFSRAEISCSSAFNGDASIVTWAESTGLFGGFGQIVAPAELTIGTNAEYPPGTPLLLEARLEDTQEAMPYAGGEFRLARGSEYLIDAHGEFPPGPSLPPPETFYVIVYAGEILDPYMYLHSSHVHGEIDVYFRALPLPEPSTLALWVALMATRARRR